MAFILKTVSLALNSPDTLFSHQALVTMTGVLKMSKMIMGYIIIQMECVKGGISG